VKVETSWHSHRLGTKVDVRRWGHFGRPVLVFPTAGGDAEEIERFLMIKVLGSLIEAGRIKVFSCDSAAGAVWLKGDTTPEQGAQYQNRFDAFVRKELVPAIRTDCRDAHADIIVAGASIGAYNAVATLCRHPDCFSHAIGMSGTYDLSRWLRGDTHTADFHFLSPLHFLPSLGDGEQLRRLRERFIILATGEGRWEAPKESWNMADVLGAKGVPNRVDAWGPDYDHDWTTWRVMLPHYLEQIC